MQNWTRPTVALTFLTAPRLLAQDPSFAAASIEPADPAAPGWLYQMPAREFRATHTSVKNLIEWAYDVHSSQIVGVPDSMAADKFNIVGTPNVEGLAGWEQWTAMVKKLLADRWQLKFHREQQELAVYALQFGNVGPKLAGSAGDPNRPWSLSPVRGDLPARNASTAMQNQLGLQLVATRAMLGVIVVDRVEKPSAN